MILIGFEAQLYVDQYILQQEESSTDFRTKICDFIKIIRLIFYKGKIVDTIS